MYLISNNSQVLVFLYDSKCVPSFQLQTMFTKSILKCEEWFRLHHPFSGNNETNVFAQMLFFILKTIASKLHLNVEQIHICLTEF